MLSELNHVATLPTIRLGLKFVLLSMVRKSELQDEVWSEVDFENAVWSIPKERMKRSRPHNVYLSTQMLDILIALRTCAGNSRYVLPSRYDADAPMSRATFNRVTTAIAQRAEKNDLPLPPFTVHDLRRTASTLLHEMGFNSDWIEKGLAHEERSSRGVYTTRPSSKPSGDIWRSSGLTRSTPGRQAAPSRPSSPFQKRAVLASIRDFDRPGDALANIWRCRSCDGFRAP